MFNFNARYRWTLLRAGEFRLDGGSMFGLIPRSVWSRSVQTDDKNRITVQHNCLLLERADSFEPAAAPGPKLALIEVGTGDKLDPASKDLFAMGDRTILTALHEVDCSRKDIGAVVTTHLHFDHAGGLTRMAQPGEKPDWHGPASGMAGSRPDHDVCFSFPNAVLYAQKREWDDALANRSVMTRTYFKDHLEPYSTHMAQARTNAVLPGLQERVRFVDSPRPFMTGYTPDRDELPRLSIEQRETQLPGLPGVRVMLCPGHTFGQQAIVFDDDKGRTIVFTPDVMPTAAHLGAAYSLAYDVEPYTSMVSKRWLLTEAAARNWTLVLDHEPGNPCKLVRANTKGWFDLVDTSP